MSEDKLTALVRIFIDDSKNYKGMQIPDDQEAKKNMLRSLMNVRMPGELSEDTLALQDEYLQERAEEKGIVEPDSIDPVSVRYGSKGSHNDVICIWKGDITRLAADAIVNAANSRMLGCFVPMHTCIDNCIHTFAGVQLRNECSNKMDELRRRYGPGYEQPTSVPMLTDAYNLPSKKVIHIVGPIVEGRLTKEHEKALAECYINVLEMCRDNNLKSVAFCGISTGVFHFPAERAAEIAVDSVRGWLDKNENCMDKVIFNVFGNRNRQIYENILV